MDLRTLKTRLPLAHVLSARGLTPDRNGMVRCPFHDDRTASMQVSGETVYCHATGCERHGQRMDVIDFVMHLEGLTKHAAIVRCKGLAGAAMLAGAGIETKPKPKAEPTEPVDYAAAHAEAVAALGRSPAARAYLTGRELGGLKDVGYNPGRSFLKAMRECVIFGLRDREGAVVSLYGRAIRAGRGRHYYSRGRRGLYPGYPTAATERLVLCESVIDAATVNAHTEYEALALYGTGGLTDEHLAALDGLTQLREVILFMDGDEAGRAAQAKHAELLRARYPAIAVCAVDVPDGADANGIAVGEGGAALLAHLIEERDTLYPSPEPAAAPSPEPEPEPAASDELDGSDSLDAHDGGLLGWRTGNLRFTLIGGVALRPADRMRVTVKIERTDSRDPLHRMRTQVDLLRDEAVERLARKGAGRLEVGTTDLLRALLELTERAERDRAQRLAEEEAGDRKARGDRWALTEAGRRRGEAFLREGDLMNRTADLIERSGVVGERENALVLWLTFLTRLRERPLHVVALGASGTGKTYLQERIADLVPPGDRIEITALSENALYYFDRTELRHKLLLIEDLDGAAHEAVMYAVRELMSKGRIAKTVALKDAGGNLRTKTVRVDGPVTVAGTTTRERLYEDNANRSLLIYLDGSPEQRERILAYQRRLSAGLVDRAAEAEARERLREVQAVLAERIAEGRRRAVRVVNPYAERLALPRECLAPLRTQAHYLAFCEAVTFYHQGQREVKRDARGEAYVETTVEDVAWANALLSEVLVAKSDELTRAARRFLERLEGYLADRGARSFYCGEVRRAWRMSPTAVNRYVGRLAAYGYVTVVGGSRARGYEYEVVRREGRSLRERVTAALDAVVRRLREGDGGADDDEGAEVAAAA